MASCQVQRGAGGSHWGSAGGRVTVPNLSSGYLFAIDMQYLLKHT